MKVTCGSCGGPVSEIHWLPGEGGRALCAGCGWVSAWRSSGRWDVTDDELDALESYWKDIHHPKYEGVYEGDALRLIAEVRRLRLAGCGHRRGNGDRCFDCGLLLGHEEWPQTAEQVERLRAAERLVEMEIRHEDCCNLRLASTDADERQRLWDELLALMREIDAGFVAYRKARGGV